MTNYNSIVEEIRLDQQQVRRELTLHGVTEREQEQFFDDTGHKEAYYISEILNWIGY